MQSDQVYSGYSSILDSVISNNDLVTAKSFISGLYPVMSDYNQDEFRTTIFSNVMRKGSLEMQELFIESFGMSAELSSSFINACLHDLGKDRSLLNIACNNIGEKYGSELAGAFVMGDIQIAEALFNANSGRRPKLSYHYGSQLIDGERVSNRSEIMAKLSSSELSSLCDLIERAGMRYILDHEQRLLGTNSLNDSKFSTKTSAFIGKLPRIDGGVIRDPELLIAFKEKGVGASFPKVFSRIPCWIPEGMIDSSEHVSIFEVHQIFKQTNNYHSINQDTPLSDIIQSYAPGHEPVSIRSGTIEFHLKPIHFEMAESDFSSASKVKSSSENILKEIVSLDILSGFGHPVGYQLAVVDIDFLSSLPVSGFSAEDLVSAKTYASTFFPASVLSNAYNQHSWDVMNDNLVGFDSYNGKEIFEALQNPLLRSHLLELIPDTLWVELYKNCGYKLAASEILDAKETLGLDDKTSSLHLKKDDIYKLYYAGFKFQSNGCVFDAHPSHNEQPDENSYIYFIRMGGWPSALPQPSTVQEGLALAIRKKNDPIYDYYLLSLGAEEVIRAAKSPAQFNHIYQIFPREEITPLLSLLPKTLKGKHLEDDLGM